jgi:preprotein translocase subunit YajC
MLIRPQRQKEKAHQKTLQNLNKNDEVVTSSGIHGTIVNVKEKTIILRIDENVKIEMEKNCIAFVKKATHPAA